MKRFHTWKRRCWTVSDVERDVARQWSVKSTWFVWFLTM